MKQAVQITGTGAISSVGFGVEALWEGMQQARPRITPILDPLIVGGEFTMYQVPYNDEVPHVIETREGRAASFVTQAAREALDQAVALNGPTDPQRTGVVIGTSMGDAEEREVGAESHSKADIYSSAAAICRELGVRGPASCLPNACAASAYAADAAVEMLKSGECDRVIVAGVETYSRMALYCFDRMGALDAQSCRPFTVDRGGTKFGEGAGALVLELVDPEENRDKSVVYLKGSATTCDSGHLTAPDPTGVHARRALLEAIESAGTSAERIGLVLPHGTGTRLNDKTESKLLHELVDDAGHIIPTYCLKALIGHTAGAAGALAMVAGVEMIKRGQVPGNVDTGEIEPAMIELVDRNPVPLQGDVVVNAYAFGGANASLVLGATL